MDQKKLSSCYCKNIRRLSNKVTKYYNDYLEGTGLTLNQYSILSSIQKIQPATVTEIAEKAGLERTTIVRDLKPLFRNGLIADISDASKRDKKIVVTDKGSDLHDQAEPYWDQAQKNIYDLLGEKRFQEFVDILNILVEL